MKKPKLKRTLYIGLGGTGFKTLVHTKKMFMETYGEIPPMIKFLAFDADVNQNTFALPSIYGDISLDPSEKSGISVDQSKSKVNHNRSNLTWLPDRNLRAVVDLVNGCGMVRTNGRIAFSFNYPKSLSAIQHALDEIRNLSHFKKNKYELLGSDVEVNIVFSIAGGTGSGTFLDMAYLVKDIFEERGITETSKIIGYMVLPDVFDAQLNFGKEKLFPNACGSLVDLDYLCHLDFNQEISVNYLTDNKKLIGTPFHTIFAIGNTNSNGDVVTHCDKISQMLSLAMVVTAGELSSGISSVANNLERDMNSGDYDIENKRATMATLGMSEITFRAQDLMRLYSAKAAREIAASLVNPGKNADIEATYWIDEAKIRENEGKDDVIDYLLSKSPNVIFQEIHDDANPGIDIENYRQQKNVSVENSVIDNKIEELKRKTNTALSEKVILLVNTAGPAYAQDFVAQVRNQIELCIGEMRTELSEFKDLVNSRESEVKTGIEEYKDACKKIFGRNSAKAEAAEALSAAVMRSVVNSREIQRRQGAITFYTWLLNRLSSIDARLDAIIGKIEEACKLISKRISAINSQLTGPRGLFEMDLTRPYIDKVTVNNGDIVLSQFLNSLSEGEKISDFDGMPPENIAKLFEKFTSNISTEADWGQMSVEDALAKLDRDEAQNLIRRAIKLSSPMCSLNFRGHLNRELHNYYYIGVQEQSSTGLEGSILNLKDCIDDNAKFEVNYASIGSKDRIVIYHQYGVFPTFALGGTSSYRHAYDKYNKNPNGYSCHFDEDLRQRMEREGYSVIPQERVDNSMELWVKGLVFGLITRNEDGVFFYYDESNDEAALDGYRTSLDTKYRDEAFRAFQQQAERLMPQYNQIMINRTKKEGQEAIDNLLEDARDKYLEKYSLNEFSMSELNNSLYKNIKEQLNKEVNFAKKNLM